ncbi:MAG: hypothetical protein EB033_12790, partial [Proteobacteria bacterium]|nr:hypothetical protein [Pseudomonadota bacterium]
MPDYPGGTGGARWWSRDETAGRVEPCVNEPGNGIQLAWGQRRPRVGVEESGALVDTDDVTCPGGTVEMPDGTGWSDPCVADKDGRAVLQMWELARDALVEISRFCLGTATGVFDHGPVVRVGEEVGLPWFDLEAVDG